MIHVQSHIIRRLFIYFVVCKEIPQRITLLFWSLSLCHLSCHEIAPDLEAHRLTTQPAAVQQCSYSQPSDSKLLLSFLTTPCALSHLRNDPAGWKFHYKLLSIPQREENPLFSPCSACSNHAKQTHLYCTCIVSYNKSAPGLKLQHMHNELWVLNIIHIGLRMCIYIYITYMYTFP